MTIRHLDRLLTPASVAVFGASDRAASVGATVWRNLRGSGFHGEVWPVNLRHDRLDGRPVYRRAADLPGVPDLAVLCTPAETIAPLVAELGRIGTRAAIVLTAGLTPGQKQAALDAAQPHVLRLLGPNCLGLLSPHIGLNASFAHIGALPGELAFVSQSGALVTAILDWASSRRIGFSHMVSLGEHCDVDFGDLLDHLASDPHTRAILLYIESVQSPRKFMSAARAAARNKPVIVVKAGRAGLGMQAAASHTGALAGADIVFDAAIRRAGMLRVDTLQDLFIAAQTLARFSGNHSDSLTIMTNGGGAGVMAADSAALQGVTLAPLGEGLLARLDPALPPNWSRANPIDLIGDAPVERYTRTLQALLDDTEGGAVLFMHSPTAIVPSTDIAQACLPLIQAAPSRVMSCWLGDGAVATARALFQNAGVADYATPEEAVHAFAMLQTYRRNQDTLMEAPAASESAAPDVPAARECVARAQAEGREWLSEDEAKAVLAAYGVPVVRTLAVGPSAEAAQQAAQSLGFPVALKIRSRDITHKSDVGGVALGLADAQAVAHAAERMLQQVRAARPEARIDGFTVQPMATRPHAQELIVGASIDPLFGPVILCGQGGTAVEVTADRAIGLPPLNRSLARELVSRTRVSRLLAGYRDHPPAQLNALYDALIAVSQMLADLPHLAELDINPLWVDEHGVLALDARMRIAREPVAGAERFAILPYPTQWVERLQWRPRPQGRAAPSPPPEGVEETWGGPAFPHARPQGRAAPSPPPEGVEETWGGPAFPHDREIVLRPIRPEDEDQHLRFLQRLDPEDIRMRIFQTRRELPRSELARLTQVDYEREMAFIAEGRDAAGEPETLGVVRLVRDPDNTEAEFAVIVRSDLKGLGLGQLLMDRLIRYARSRGTPRLVGVVLRENQAMLALAHSVGFVTDTQAPPQPDTVRLVRATDAPMPADGAR